MTRYLRGIAIKALLVITAAVAAVILGEIVLRAIQPFPGRYLTWPPNLRKVFRPYPEFIPGVTSPARYAINGEGVRGDAFSQDQKLRILAMGGSTAECFYQDQERTWPALFEQHLRRTRPELNAWVGNLGKSGFNSRHHVVQMKYEVPRLPRLDIIITLVGCNDLGLRLIQAGSYDPEYLTTSYGEQHQIRRTFWYYPLGFAFLRDPKDTAWWRLIHRATSMDSSPLALDDHGESVARFRERRRNAARLLDRLPDMKAALDEYARNLNTIIDLGQKLSVRMVFLTQPSLWRPDLTDSEKALFWGGRAGDFESEDQGQYYSIDALKKGMDLYNRKLMEVCTLRSIECIDLAARIPKDTKTFFDEVHFTDQGSRMVAEVLAAYFDASPSQGAADGR